VSNYAKANGRAEKLDALLASGGTRVKEQSDFVRTHTVLDKLEFVNSDSMAARDVALYYAIVPYGDPAAI
jgi:hypothetical protein